MEILFTLQIICIIHNELFCNLSEGYMETPVTNTFCYIVLPQTPSKFSPFLENFFLKSFCNINPLSAKPLSEKSLFSPA